MKGNYFQIIIIAVFIVAAVLGVLVFSGAIPIGGNSNTPGSKGTVVLWGTVPSEAIAQAIDDFNTANPTFIVTYTEKSADTFDQDLLEALASGTGPDMVLLPDNLAFHYANKIFTVPYTSYPLATFKTVFAGAGEVFETQNGFLAFPLTIDPLMLYYNRSILNANGVVYPPATWDDLTALVPTLTKKDSSGVITQSAVALGQYSNVVHAKDILAMLFMQDGNPIVSESGGAYNSVLDSQVGQYDVPSTLQFYTNFADPNNADYSWNKSFDNSDDVFSAEQSAFYFGYASELSTLVNKNPNQDFFVAPVPQIKGSISKITDAHVMGIAVLASSKHLSTAFTAADLMATTDFASAFAGATDTPPARRDLLAVKPADAYSPIFYDSALFAKSWLDPSPTDTDTIFGGMVENEKIFFNTRNFSRIV